MNIEERIKPIYLNSKIIRCVIKYNKIIKVKGKNKKDAELNELFKANDLINANEMRIH